MRGSIPLHPASGHGDHPGALFPRASPNGHGDHFGAVSQKVDTVIAPPPYFLVRPQVDPVIASRGSIAASGHGDRNSAKFPLAPRKPLD